MVLRDTVWNRAYGLPTIEVPPYSTDDDPGLSDDDKIAIVQIWRAVAEDFSAWDVDVTTEDSASGGGGGGYAPLGPAGVRAAVGGSFALLGPKAAPAGGAAYVNSFGRDADFGPALVFSADLDGANPREVAAAISHEVGHALGLSHDGRAAPATREYYAGHGVWAPIMGLAWGKQGACCLFIASVLPCSPSPSIQGPRLGCFSFLRVCLSISPRMFSSRFPAINVKTHSHTTHTCSL